MGEGYLGEVVDPRGGRGHVASTAGVALAITTQVVITACRYKLRTSKIRNLPYNRHMMFLLFFVLF